MMRYLCEIEKRELLQEDERKRKKRERKRERERDSGAEMRVTAGTRRVQVGQIWRTEVPYGPRKPASALRPPGPCATSLSVLSSATAIYHLRRPVIPSRLRRKASPTRARGNTRMRTERDACKRVRITACRRICFDHIPSTRIIGSAMYRVFFRESSSPCALYERAMIFCGT